MPFYEYQCPECGDTFERMLSMSRSDEPQSCPVCNVVGSKLISQCGVIFKGDDWASKNNRIAGQMRDKNNRLGKAQNERKREAPVTSLAPNVDGERVGSWTEAQSLAKSKGKDETTYAPMVAAEQAKKKG